MHPGTQLAECCASSALLCLTLFRDNSAWRVGTTPIGTIDPAGQIDCLLAVAASLSWLVKDTQVIKSKIAGKKSVDRARFRTAAAGFDGQQALCEGLS
jgi:hypothetical protein